LLHFARRTQIRCAKIRRTQIQTHFKNNGGLSEVLAEVKNYVRVFADQGVAPRRVDQPVVTGGIYPVIMICGSTIQNRMTENQNNGAVQIGNKDEFDQEQDKKKIQCTIIHKNTQKVNGKK
jgi:hypothetical protein